MIYLILTPDVQETLVALEVKLTAMLMASFYKDQVYLMEICLGLI